MSLSILAIILGLGLALLQAYGLARPTAYAQHLRKFPRSLAWGWVLMLAGTAWFLWNLNEESIADFASWKDMLLAAFAAIGVGSCVFVQDFLAVRGFAVVLLLLAKLMVDAGRTRLGQTGWVLVFQAAAYVLVVAGIWFTVSPWRLRDFFNWATASDKRLKLGCSLSLAFGLFVAALGVVKF